MQSCLADLGRANGHGLGNTEGDGGVVSDGFVVKFGALPLCEAYDERHRSKFTLTCRVIKKRLCEYVISRTLAKEDYKGRQSSFELIYISLLQFFLYFLQYIGKTKVRRGDWLSDRTRKAPLNPQDGGYAHVPQE